MTLQERLDDIGAAIAARRFDDALSATDLALERFPGDTALQARHGALLRHLFRLDDSLAYLRDRCASHPADAGLRLELGLTQRAVGDYPAAMASFDTILSTRPDHRAALRARVETATRFLRFDTALDLAEEGLTLVGGDLPLQLRKAGALRHLGDLDAAEKMLLSLSERVPDHAGVRLELALLRRQQGALDQSAALIDGILAIDPTHRLALQERVENALRQRKPDSALDLAEDGLARCPDDLGLALRKASVLRQLFRLDESLGVLVRLSETHPRHPGVSLERALTLQVMGQSDAARVALDAVLMADPLHRGALLARIEIAAGEGRLDEAVAFGRLALRGFPVAGMVQQITRLLLACDAPEAALRVLEGRPDREADDATVGFARIRVLYRLGRLAEAGERLDALVPDATLARPRPGEMLQACDFVNRPDMCFEIAARAVDRGQIDETILRYVLCEAHAQGVIGQDDPDHRRLLQRLSGDGTPAEIEELLIRNQQFDDAYLSLTARFSGRRSPREALLMARCLFGQARYELGLRYTGLCLRRWPADLPLANLLFSQFLKLGRLGAAGTLLERLRVARVLPDRTLAGMQTRLLIESGRAGDLTARGDIARLDLWARRSLWRQQLLSDSPEAAADVDDAQIWDWDNVTARHWSAHLEGQLAIEAGALCDDATDGDIEAAKAAILAKPQATVRALRLIDRMRAVPEDGWSPTAENAPAAIPRVIFQYWDTAELPEGVDDFMDSWRATPGYQHRRFDERSAADLLRRNFGPKWLSAFRLARNPAEAADFLRLCLLARYGGVWADADDVRYGDLNRLLGTHRGFLGYVEPLGGAVANNFVAASPRHPVLRRAAVLARGALLRGDNDNTWTKTGPGLLTRAVAQYLAHCGGFGLPPELRLLDAATVRRVVSIHNPLPHKRTAKYWNPQTKQGFDFAPLVETLAGQR